MGQIEWVVGPLAQPASKDWTYWCPQLDGGLWRAFYMPNFQEEHLLGDDLPTLEEAKRLCEEHLAARGKDA